MFTSTTTAARHTRTDSFAALRMQVRVTAQSDPDLLWALRGGGGDHAIVTAMEIRRAQGSRAR
jgi:hypothetical protein